MTLEEAEAQKSSLLTLKGKLFKHNHSTAKMRVSDVIVSKMHGSPEFRVDIIALGDHGAIADESSLFLARYTVVE